MHQVLLELFFGRFPAVWCSWITYPRIFIEVTDDRSAASEKTVQLYWSISVKEGSSRSDRCLSNRYLNCSESLIELDRIGSHTLHVDADNWFLEHCFRWDNAFSFNQVKEDSLQSRQMFLESFPGLFWAVWCTWITSPPHISEDNQFFRCCFRTETTLILKNTKTWSSKSPGMFSESFPELFWAVWCTQVTSPPHNFSR